MKRMFFGITMAVSMFLAMSDALAAQPYGSILCKQPGYTCYQVKSGDTWTTLFPNETSRDIVMRANRVNMNLRVGSIIAIPDNLDKINYLDVSPFPIKHTVNGHKTIIVDLNQLAWGAYDEQGNLIHWGPASGGRGWCGDVHRPCRTQTGNYTVYNKQGYDCISSKFPYPYGGAAMPFCMHYFKAFALHGSFEVPGYNDSHGCIRMFINDARWLNYNFVDYGTKVVVKPY